MGGQAAYSYDLSIQLCMCFPRHTMTSVELASITQARASDDYHPGNNQWRVGISAIFNSAIDIAPSKDNFWSMPDVQPNSPYGNTTCEPYNRLQALVQSLSNGPYSFSDQIGYSDVDLIMRCCNSDGLVLRPDVSATEIDKYFLNAAGLDSSDNLLSGDGEVWVSTSVIGESEYFRYYYVFSVNLEQTFDLFPSFIDIYRDRAKGDEEVTQWIGFETNSTNEFVLFNESSPIELQKSDKFTFEYYTLIPMYSSDMESGYYLQGEVDKNIAVSRQRFNAIEVEDSGALTVTVSGAVGETVNVAFVKYPELKQMIVHCEIGETQTAVVRVPDMTCTPY